MDTERIRQIIELSKASRAAEIAVETPAGKIRVRRFPRQAEAAQVAEELAREQEPLAAAAPYGQRRQGTVVKAPYVGVFRRGERDGERPLVAIGQEVSGGQVLAVIETLNVPNEVTAPGPGWVQEVLVEEGAKVQYGDALMVLSRDKPEE